MNESLLPLMEGRVPSVAHSPTSRLAAGAVKPKAGTQRAIVLEHITSRATFGVADFEGIRDLAGVIDSVANAYRARRDSLAKDGLIKKRATGRVNPDSNQLCDVWIAAGVNDTTVGGAQ